MLDKMAQGNPSLMSRHYQSVLEMFGKALFSLEPVDKSNQDGAMVNVFNVGGENTKLNKFITTEVTYLCFSVSQVQTSVFCGGPAGFA